MSYYAAQPYAVVPAGTHAQTYTQHTYDPNGTYTTAVPQYQAAAPQAFIPAPQQYTTYSSRDELRTIFVTGFPQDVRERELVNLCRFMPGYEAASMKSSPHGAHQGFVLFAFGQQATAALQMVNGIECFSEDQEATKRRKYTSHLVHVCSFGDGCKLRAEMARKNMYVRSGADERPAKVFRTDNGPVPAHSPTPGGPSPGPDRNTDNPPCDTLFVGNLSPNMTEADVEAYFRSLMGDRFAACKLSRSVANRVSAFVQFVDVATAEEVHASQQGVEMPGSDRGPMRIQFSKNALGEFGKRRREAAAAAAAAAQAGGSPNGAVQPPVDHQAQPLNTAAAPAGHPLAAPMNNTGMPVVSLEQGPQMVAITGVQAPVQVVPP